MADVGRPTTFRPEYCELIQEMARQGMSVSEWAAELGVARSSFWDWAQSSEEFSAAYARAKTLEQATWERKAWDNLDNRNFNSAVWAKSMSARFREDYTERQQVDQNISGTIDQQITAIQRTVIDPKSLSDENLASLAEILENQKTKPLVIEHSADDTNPLNKDDNK